MIARLPKEIKNSQEAIKMKLSFKTILPILLIFTLLILFAGCFITPSPGYIPPTYTVTYDGNTNTGGVAPTDTNLYEQGVSVTVLDQGSLVKTGYTFGGWNTATDGSGPSQAAGSTFIMGTANVTLYAQWTINSYTVTFNSQGGSAVNTQTVEHGGKVTEPTDPTKTGHTFGGWYKESGCTNAWDFDSDTVTADVTLYAKWTAAPVVKTVTVGDLQGGAIQATVAAPGRTYVVTTANIADGTAATITWYTDAIKTATGAAPAGIAIAPAATVAANAVTLNVTVTETTPTVEGNYFFTATIDGVESAVKTLAITAAPVAVGDSYGGGKVAYIDGTGLHGLIAALSDQGSSTWGCYGTAISGADGTAIGTGHQNTHDMITAGCTNAAQLCHGVTINGYNDWYLPSKDELDKLYLNRVAIGGFADNGYWSSSEQNKNSAWKQDFNVGNQSSNNKSDLLRVRAVRTF